MWVPDVSAQDPNSACPSKASSGPESAGGEGPPAFVHSTVRVGRLRPLVAARGQSRHTRPPGIYRLCGTARDRVPRLGISTCCHLCQLPRPAAQVGKKVRPGLGVPGKEQGLGSHTQHLFTHACTPAAWHPVPPPSPQVGLGSGRDDDRKEKQPFQLRGMEVGRWGSRDTGLWGPGHVQRLWV